ncbi:sigma factor-like helix-turn-helix DNA-binding protein [Dysosmobacter sp.]|uniref:sigma factor-like helix-turn-helix DNA-binding protein n=1 Tax=Dysosmobacter sp. TaxID=2591382 RepID=UPI003AB310D9
MNSSLNTFRRQEQRRQSHEFSCQAAHPPPDDAFDALRARLLLHDLFLLADEEQALLIRHRLCGCSLAETARREGISVKRVRRRLKALYRAYFTQKEIKPEGVVTHEKYPYRSRDPDASSGGRQPRPHL